MGKLQHAGGYRIGEGTGAYPNLKYWQLKPWITTVRRFLVTRIKAGDSDVLAMLREAHAEWSSWECTPYHHYPTLTPLGKAQLILAHIVRQRHNAAHNAVTTRSKLCTRSMQHLHKHSVNAVVLEVISTFIAVELFVTHAPDLPLRSPYFRDVQVGLSIRRLLRPEFRTYEREDSRTGEIIQTRVKLTKPVRLRSRYACQRIEKAIGKHAGWVINRHSSALLSLLGEGLCEINGLYCMPPIKEGKL